MFEFIYDGLKLESILLGKKDPLRRCDHGTKLFFAYFSLTSNTSIQKKQCKTEFVCRCAVWWLSWWTSRSTSMWPPGSSSWPTIRIIRGTFFRFFIVAYAHDFVKNGQFEIRLFHQIYWLAWMDRAGKIATFSQPERKLPPCTQFRRVFHFQKSVKINLGRCGPHSQFGQCPKARFFIWHVFS